MRGERGREAVRREALRLFAEHGIDAVSIRDIAAAAAMSAANIYAHHASKEALVTTLFREGYAEYGRLLADAAAGAGRPFRGRLDAMIRLICRLHDEDAIRFRFLITAQHAQIRDIARNTDNPVEIICRAVAEAMAEGAVPAGDHDLLGLAVIGVVVQAATGHLYGRLTGGLVGRADILADLCWRLLR